MSWKSFGISITKLRCDEWRGDRNPLLIYPRRQAHGIIKKAYGGGHYQVSIEQKSPNLFVYESKTPPLLFSGEAKSLVQAKREVRKQIGDRGKGNMRWRQVEVEIVNKG